MPGDGKLYSTAYRRLQKVYNKTDLQTAMIIFKQLRGVGDKEVAHIVQILPDVNLPNKAQIRDWMNKIILAHPRLCAITAKEVGGKKIYSRFEITLESLLNDLKTQVPDRFDIDREGKNGKVLARSCSYLAHVLRGTDVHRRRRRRRTTCWHRIRRCQWRSSWQERLQG